MIGLRAVLVALREGRDPRAVVQLWQPGLAQFIRTRAKYLIY
jgi:hypothetical protein